MESIQTPPTARVVWSIPAVYSALAVTSLAAAGIHFAVIGEHFDEYFAFGLFFSVVAWLQALWALGVVVAPTRPLLRAGLVGNAVVVGVWVISRTTGLPIGPEPGTPEPAAFLDVLSTVFEAGIVAGTVALLVRPRSPREDRGGRTGSLAVGAFAVALVLLTTAAVASGDNGEAGHAGEEHSDGDQTTGDSGPTRIDMGKGRILQALVEESGGAARMTLTFFNAEGGALKLDSLSVTGISPLGEEITIPVRRFEPGHYAASLALESGRWQFGLEGVASHGGEFTATFPAEVP